VFISHHWMARIYKVKPPRNGRRKKSKSWDAGYLSSSCMNSWGEEMGFCLLCASSLQVGYVGCLQSCSVAIKLQADIT
ncbi:unnamed protein product, partial [Linum tenue]